jgi:hypothetical protein
MTKHCEETWAYGKATKMPISDEEMPQFQRALKKTRQLTLISLSC